MRSVKCIEMGQYFFRKLLFRKIFKIKVTNTNNVSTKLELVLNFEGHNI